MSRMVYTKGTREELARARARAPDHEKDDRNAGR